MRYALGSPRRDFWDGFFGFEELQKGSSLIEQTKNGQVIRLATPGLKREELQTYIIGERLYVAYTGERKAFQEPFKQTWLLPKGFDATTMTASYEDGVLSIKLPNPPKPEIRRHNVQIN